mmetsp:Transcript_41941/g.115684  ORF Transcript_41941/g.115684 Transcript_41941/m.115684 type:complete len:203 (+) Transcript_41941:778-1386(+)
MPHQRPTFVGASASDSRGNQALGRTRQREVEIRIAPDIAILPYPQEGVNVSCTPEQQLVLGILERSVSPTQQCAYLRGCRRAIAEQRGGRCADGDVARRAAKERHLPRLGLLREAHHRGIPGLREIGHNVCVAPTRTLAMEPDAKVRQGDAAQSGVHGVIPFVFASARQHCPIRGAFVKLLQDALHKWPDIIRGWRRRRFGA